MGTFIARRRVKIGGLIYGPGALVPDGAVTGTVLDRLLGLGMIGGGGSAGGGGSGPPAPRDYTFSMAGALTVGSSIVSVRPGAGVLAKIRTGVRVAPQGAPVLIDVLRNGSSILAGSPITINTGSRLADRNLGITITDSDEISIAVLSVGLAEGAMALRPNQTTDFWDSGASTATLIKPPVPTATKAGDLMLAWINLHQGSSDSVAASGWTEVGRKANGTQNCLILMSKIADEGEQTPVFTVPISKPAAAVITSIARAIIDVRSAGLASSGPQAVVNFDSIVTTEDGVQIIQVAGFSTPLTPLPGTTSFAQTGTSFAESAYVGQKQQARATGSVNAGIAVWQGTAGAAGTYGPYSVTGSGSPAHNVGMQIALRQNNTGNPGSGLAVQLLHQPA